MNDFIKDPLTIARFWSKVQVGENDECWPWLGATDSDGYGQLRISNPRKLIASNRVSLQLYLGRALLPGEWALHRCDNPPCCNPIHLYPGDRSANVRDALERGQMKPRSQAGEKNGNARLTAPDVIDIKRRIAAGQNNTVIARDYKVGHATISSIRRGKSWPEITSP